MQIKDSQRDRVVHELRERYATGELTDDALERSVAVALTTQSENELLDLLPASPGGGPTALAAGADLTAAEAERLARHLSPGETVEWLGRPDPTKHFSRGDVFLVPFSILWCGFAIFWEAAAVGGHAGAFFALWGVPFVLVGLYFVVGRFFYKAQRKRRTLYAVTSERVLSIVATGRGEAVDASYLAAIPGVTTVVGAGGTGTVSFGNVSPAATWYGNSGLELMGRGAGAPPALTFYDVEGPQGVAELVERLRRRRRASVSPT